MGEEDGPGVIDLAQPERRFGAAAISTHMPQFKLPSRRVFGVTTFGNSYQRSSANVAMIGQFDQGLAFFVRLISRLNNRHDEWFML